jgi:hypothetical protein
MRSLFIQLAVSVVVRTIDVYQRSAVADESEIFDPRNELLFVIDLKGFSWSLIASFYWVLFWCLGITERLSLT